jgi:hypothetical protein
MTSPGPRAELDPSPWLGLVPLPWLFLICTADLLRLVVERAAYPAKPSARLDRVEGGRASDGHPDRRDPGARRPNTGIAQHPLRGAGPRLQNNQENAMTCKAEIRRRCRTREDACAYLSSRGFLCLPSGWANGRWAATLDMDRDGCVVTIWLRTEAEPREIRAINRNWGASMEGAPAA